MVDIPNTNVILGVQWLITLEKVTTDWETLHMEWTDEKSGKHQRTRGMHTYPPQEASAHNTETDLCRGGKTKPVYSSMQYTLDHDFTVFRGIQPRRPPDQKLVKEFSQLVAPLTDLGKRGAFDGKNTAQRAFDWLKEEMNIFPVLVLPDLINPFAL